VYLGDRPEDEQAAQRAGVPFQWAWDWIEQHQEAIAPKMNKLPNEQAYDFNGHGTGSSNIKKRSSPSCLIAV
jgi:hypothetical protein